jgi:hypothetical protein
MIALPAGARILLATQPVDFRKGAHGLAAFAAEVLGEDPFSGVLLVLSVVHGYGPRTARGRMVAGRVADIQGCPACRSTYGPPRLQVLLASSLISLRQRMRSRGNAPAKMESRAFWSS